ncbi:MAG TPA: sigma-70 family RNA polymerase sigma factor [Ktedonobacteraceae bacterium]|nr:sigma-70 family RNA polymerase sigma factor [Ktedonobacteraceae bacterium]
MEKHTIEVSGDFVSPEERARLMRLCHGITRNRDAAEDLVQETLLEAWRHEHSLRDQERRAKWLSGIARNVCLRWLRKDGKEAAHLVDARVKSDDLDVTQYELEDSLADDFDIEVELERKELVELLDRAMALLPVETRHVLVKRYVEESSLAEVAEQLGTNVSAVAMRLQRGKLALQTHPRIRTLPSQEVEADGRRVILLRYESVTGNAKLTVASDYETYEVLRMYGADQ